MQKQTDIDEIVEKYSDMVYRIALTRCQSIENAEDIFQEVFMKYSERAPVFENCEHEKAWFIRVTINLSKNIRKSVWNKRVTNLEDNIILENDNKKEIFEIVSKLPKNYKTVIYLFYYEGYKVKEISKLMKTSEGTIKTWLFRAREMLKEKIEGGFENE
ncbi:MAG: sigma-70 family RNA polymerase sigma factor [Clostridia bacterium]|nr:sigma-70 family RNA polymerase sigma factor [Clostridia bacterium]